MLCKGRTPKQENRSRLNCGFPALMGICEDSLLGYVRFLIEDEDRWPYLKLATPSDLNSGMPVSDGYRSDACRMARSGIAAVG